MKTIFTDWRLTSYRDAWKKQQDYFYAQVKRKQQKLTMAENVIIFCEHPHVYTLQVLVPKGEGVGGRDSKVWPKECPVQNNFPYPNLLK